MSINRHNYEEFFILYMDNELSSEDRRQVELFVNENPDLKTELDLLLQSRLTPDTAVVFTNKEQLLRTPAGVDAINLSNYEEWLLSYTDNELSADQKILVERFVAAHPALQQELEQLQKTKLQPDTAIVFAHKEILYRKEEKVRVISMGWKRVAIAAALLLAVSTTAFIVFNNSNKQKDIVSNEEKEKPEQKKSTPEIQQPVNEIASADAGVSNKTNDVIEENNDAVDPKKKTIELKQKIVPNLLPKREEPVLADKTEKETNNLPQPTNNPYINKPTIDNPIAMTEPSTVKEAPLTNLKETNSIPPVTLTNSQPLDVRTASLTEPVDEEQPGKKNKLRGFFRKVTRTFEKTTNIKATDDEDRLLLGGLAIKL